MAKFSEKDTYEPLAQEINQRLGSEYECRIGERLTYSLNYDADLETEEQRFETDLSIFEDGTPRLVIEVKHETVSTHGLMYTNDKAEKHKQVFPFLRYGLLVTSSKRNLTKKYLWHNRLLDFIYKGQQEMEDEADLNQQEMDELGSIIDENLQYSKEYEQILTGDSDKYSMIHRSEFL